LYSDGSLSANGRLRRRLVLNGRQVDDEDCPIMF